MELPTPFWPVFMICLLFQVWLTMLGIGALAEGINDLEAPDGFFEGVGFVVEIGAIIIRVLIDIITGTELGWPIYFALPINLTCGIIIVVGLFSIITEGLKAVGAITPFTIVFLLLAAPVAAQDAYTADIDAGVLNAGQVRVYVSDSPKVHVDDQVLISVVVDAPPPAGTNTGSITITAGSATGCTLGAFTPTATDEGLGASAAVPVTVTARSCTFLVDVTVTGDDGTPQTVYAGHHAVVITSAPSFWEQWIPSTFFLGALVLVFWRMLKAGPIWLFTLVMLTLAFLGITFNAPDWTAQAGLVVILFGIWIAALNARFGIHPSEKIE